MGVEEMMPALVKSGPGPRGVRLEQVPRPTPREGTALVAVEATGVCGTDLHIADDEYGCEAPVVMGHEILGRVQSAGSREDDGWAGRRVVCETYFRTCGICDSCRDGRRNLCRGRRSIGSYEDGGFAPLVEVPVGNLHEVPPEVEALRGSAPVLAEPLACVTHCLLDPPLISAGDAVLVVGPGAMGQICAQVARAQGGDVMLSGLEADAPRLQVAASLGLRTSAEHPAQDRFDVVIEASGSAGGAATALRSARRGGRYVQVGIFGADVSVPLDAVLYKELTMTSGFASTPASWRRAMGLLRSGAVQLGPLVTKEVPLERALDAFDAVRRGEGIKTIVRPS